MLINPKLTQIVQSLIPEARIESFKIDSAGLSLYLINEDYPQGALPNEVAYQLMEQPLYWAFCWASGAVLASYIRNNPNLVKGKSLIDFGCGSGVVAIAAAQAGADRVLACDIDTNALLATKENAALNGVEIELCDSFDSIAERFEVLTAADVLYDRENLPWLDKFNQKSQQVLLADSRIKNFQHPKYSRLGQYDACTLPDLDESDEFRLVTLYNSGLHT